MSVSVASSLTRGVQSPYSLAPGFLQMDGRVPVILQEDTTHSGPSGVVLRAKGKSPCRFPETEGSRAPVGSTHPLHKNLFPCSMGPVDLVAVLRRPT